MKCVLKAKCNKEVFLDNTYNSIECKQRGEYTYGFYYAKKYAQEDADELHAKLQVEYKILDGWEVDGFVTFLK